MISWLRRKLHVGIVAGGSPSGLVDWAKVKGTR